MKQFKPLIITAIVLALLAVAIFCIMAFFPEDYGAPVTNTPHFSADDTIKVIDKDASDLKAIEISTDSGERFAIDFSVESLNFLNASLRNSDPRLEYDNDAFVSLARYITQLSASDEIPEGGEASAFGFDNPRRTVNLTFNDGETISLLVGNETPLGTGSYVKLLNQQSIYIIGESTAALLMKLPVDYRYVFLFTPPQSSDMIQTASFERPGMKTIRVERKTDSDSGAGNGNTPAALTSDYLVTSPVRADASTDTVYTKFLDKIIGIKATAIAEDIPKDLGKYGLDAPSRLSFTTADGASVSILIGDRAPDFGRYVMREGIPSVLITEADIDFMSISHSDIVRRLIWFYDSLDIDRIEYELSDGARHTLDINRNGDLIEGVYDGVRIENDNARNLYLRTVRFTLQGAFESGSKYGKSSIKIKMYLKTGRTTTLELAKMNERQYAAIIDESAPDFFVGTDEVSELLEVFDMLKNGEKIPDMF